MALSERLVRLSITGYTVNRDREDALLEGAYDSLAAMGMKAIVVTLSHQEVSGFPAYVQSHIDALETAGVSFYFGRRLWPSFGTAGSTPLPGVEYDSSWYLAHFQQLVTDEAALAAQGCVGTATDAEPYGESLLSYLKEGIPSEFIFRIRDAIDTAATSSARCDFGYPGVFPSLPGSDFSYQATGQGVKVRMGRRGSVFLDRPGYHYGNAFTRMGNKRLCNKTYRYDEAADLPIYDDWVVNDDEWGTITAEVNNWGTWVMQVGNPLGHTGSPLPRTSAEYWAIDFDAVQTRFADVTGSWVYIDMDEADKVIAELEAAMP